MDWGLRPPFFFKDFMYTDTREVKTSVPSEAVSMSIDSDCGVVPLRVIAKCVATNEQLLENIESCIERGYPEFVPSLTMHDGTCVLVGAGPSTPQFVEEIREHQESGKPIVAIKGAHDFLLDHGIKPDICVMLDPQASMTKWIKKKNTYVRYLIASQCHPDLFGHLQGCKVIVFHALSMIGEDKILGPSRILIGGGTTSGLRAFNLMWLQGFKKFICYGYDSCIGENNAIDFYGNPNEKRRLQIFVGDGEKRKGFWTTPAMAAQANELQPILKLFNGIEVEFKGDGLLAAIMEQVNEKRESVEVAVEA